MPVNRLAFVAISSVSEQLELQRQYLDLISYVQKYLIGSGEAYVLQPLNPSQVSVACRASVQLRARSMNRCPGLHNVPLKGAAEFGQCKNHHHSLIV